METFYVILGHFITLVYEVLVVVVTSRSTRMYSRVSSRTKLAYPMEVLSTTYVSWHNMKTASATVRGKTMRTHSLGSAAPLLGIGT